MRILLARVLPLILFLLLFTRTSLLAGESRPTSQGDIKKAIERARALRAQTKLVPGVLQSSGLILKAGDVRLGQATLRIDDAKGEGGATYKLSEQYKTAIVEDGKGAQIRYSGTLLLGSDLALLSGELKQTAELKDSDGKEQTATTTITLKLDGDTLTYERTAQRKGEDKPFASEKKKIALHGERPMPMNALLGLAVFVSNAEKDGWKPDPKNALCVPVLDLNWEMVDVGVEPAWVSFDQPTYMEPKNTAAVMRVRVLVGEVGEKGLEVDAPEPQVWRAVQTWALDARAKALAHPAPPDPRIKIEPADAESVDIETPLDLAKIGAALK
ncbi:MAG TPA: hypothetical protein VEK08_19040 [Planctomycetota bacterium]|nr:hypothetical protein [Planctomycetota bacterium]